MPFVIFFISKLFLLSMEISSIYIRLVCLIGKGVEERGCGVNFINFPALFVEIGKKHKHHSQASQCRVLCNPLFVRYLRKEKKPT